MLGYENDQTKLLSPKIHLPPAGILLFAVLSMLAWWFGMTQPALLARFYPISRLDIYYLRAFGTPALIRIVFAFLIIAASYWAAYRLAEKASGKHAWAAIFVGFALQGAVLLLMAPFTSTDIFYNIAHGRIIAVYHANPFKLLTANFPYDPFTRFAGVAVFTICVWAAVGVYGCRGSLPGRKWDF